MLQRLILFTAAAVVGACASGPGARELSQQCNVKYREEPPSGATPAKPIIEPRPSLVALRDYPQSYACVAISVNERGEVTGAKLLETDSPGLGEYWLKVTSQAKYTPGTLHGNPVPTKAIISIGIE